MIKIKGLNKKYKKHYVLKNFSYVFDKGVYLVVGKSGSGKTTLLNIISGYDKRYEGRLRIEDNLVYFCEPDVLPNELKVKDIN